MKRSLLACVLALVGCTIPPEPAPQAPVMKDNLGVDFGNIQGLALGVPDGEDPARQQLFTFDASNQLQPVNLTTTGSGNPSALYDTPRFVLIVVSEVTHQEQPCASLLVRKSDAAMFCVPVAPASTRVRNAARVQWGATGDLVTLDSGNALHRLEVTGDALQVTTLRFDGAELVNFAINAADDVMVNLRQDISTIIRVYPRTGAPVFISARYQTCVFPGPAGSRDFYLALGGGDAKTVDRVRWQENGTYAEPTNVWRVGRDDWDNCGVIYRDPSQLIVQSASFLPEVLQVPDASGTAQVLGVRMKTARSGAFFNWGQDSEGLAFVTRTHLPDLIPVELLKAAPYRLGKVDVSPLGEVTFAATRMSDGVRVLGTLRAGTLTLQELAQPQLEITTLVRIH